MAEKQLKSIKFPGLDDIYVIPEGGAGAVDIDLEGSAEGGVKPQSPLQHTESGDYFYPLTTIDQVLMEDGSRLSNLNYITIESGDAPKGEIAEVNAKTLNGKFENELVVAKASNSDRLGGVDADQYIKKDDAMVVTKNYSVVGGPNQPENPAENMIWVQTEDTNIDKVHISSGMPIGYSDKDIWIYNCTYSNVAFDAIKIGNDSMNTVYPISAKQYISGEWVAKTAKIYQGGEWIQFSSDRYYLFKSGEGALVSLKTYRETKAKVSVTTDNISTSASSNGNCYASIRTESKINLSDYTKMCITYTADTPEWDGNIAFVTSTAFTSGDSQSANFIATAPIGETTFATTAIVDLLTISESLYCGFYYCGTLSVTEWWLE